MLENIIGLLKKDLIEVTKKVRLASIETTEKGQIGKIPREHREKMILFTKRYLDELVKLNKRCGLFKDDIGRVRQFLIQLEESLDDQSK